MAITIKSETERLQALYADADPRKREVAEGLIVQAARLRVQLDKLWKDIQKNGATELFQQSQSAPPYERERPAARLHVATNKEYRDVIRQLNDLLPDKKPPSRLAMMRDE